MNLKLLLDLDNDFFMLRKDFYMDNQNITPTNMPQFSLYLILSILMLFCNLLCGIIALVFTCDANSSYKAGDVADCDTKTGYARTALIIGACLLGIGVVFSILMSVGLIFGTIATL